MKNDTGKIVCFFCFLLGTVAPWALLVTGAGIAFASESETLAQISAWLMFVGLGLMGASALFSNIVSRVSRNI